MRPASADCLRDALQTVEERRDEGYRPVYGKLLPGRVDLDDGVTQSSGFRFDIEGALGPVKGGKGAVPDSGRVTVWYPVSQFQLPEPGRHVLLLELTDRPAEGSGEPLYSFAPELAPPLADDNRVTLPCGAPADDGRSADEGTAELSRLRVG